MPYGTPTPAVTGRRPTMLHWAAIVPVVLYLVAEFVWQYPLAKTKATSPEFALSFQMGRVIGGILIPLGVAAVVWWTSHSRRASTWTFSALVLLFAAYAVADGTLLRQRRGVQVALNAVVPPLEQKRTAAEVDLRAATSGGALDLSTIKGKADLDRRLSMLDAALKSNAELLTAGDAAERDLTRAFDERQVPAAERERSLADFRKRYNWAQGRDVYGSSRQILLAARDVLVFLRDNDGHWRYDAAERRVDLDTDERVEAFNRLQTALQGAIRHQQELGLRSGRTTVKE